MTKIGIGSICGLNIVTEKSHLHNKFTYTKSMITEVIKVCKKVVFIGGTNEFNWFLLSKFPVFLKRVVCGVSILYWLFMLAGFV